MPKLEPQVKYFGFQLSIDYPRIRRFIIINSSTIMVITAAILLLGVVVMKVYTDLHSQPKTFPIILLRKARGWQGSI